MYIFDILAPKLEVKSPYETPIGGAGIFMIVLLVFVTLGGVGFFVYKKRPSFYNPYYHRRNSQYTELLGEIHI